MRPAALSMPEDDGPVAAIAERVDVVAKVAGRAGGRLAVHALDLSEPERRTLRVLGIRWPCFGDGRRARRGQL